MNDRSRYTICGDFDTSDDSVQVRLLNEAFKTNYHILFMFPVRFRRDKFFSTLDKYYQLLSENPAFSFVITLDTDDREMNTAQVKSRLAKYRNLTFHYGDHKNKIEAMNDNVPAAGWDIVVLVSDDMIPLMKGFDTVIRRKMLAFYPDTDGVLFFNDGYNGKKLNSLSIMGKAFYDRFGYIYYPGYKSTWSDREFMDVSEELGLVTYFEDCIIQHQHYDFGYNGAYDALMKRNTNPAFGDEALYWSRKESGFPKSEISNSKSEIIKA
jgi:hypothetical protein